MSKVICIPCLNMSNYEFIIHRHSVAKCSLCGNKSERLRQMLLVSIIGIKECRQEDGCDKVKIKWVCKEEGCPYTKLIAYKEIKHG